MKKVCRRPEIHCCIVDDHCDIVPFAYEYQRLCLINGFSELNALVIHVDAHPDLSIPSSSLSKGMNDWDNIDLLYDILLEEEGGIAEFIFPLVHHKIFSQIVWVRSPWSNQLPDGTSTFHLSMNPVQTNFLTPYYLDENICMTDVVGETLEVNLTTCLAENSVTWQKHETELCHRKASHTNEFTIFEREDSKYWILDICLDYFSTYNPFLVEILSLAKDVDDLVGLQFSLQWLLSSMTYRTITQEEIANLDQHSIEAARKRCISQWESAFESIPGSKPEVLWECVGRSPLDGDIPTYVRDFMDRQWSLLSPTICKMIAEYKHLLLLPHNPVLDNNTIDDMIIRLKEFIRRLVIQVKAPPIFVTIARSVSDGYTPASMADELQRRVLAMTRDVILEVLQVDFEIVTHDLTEECIEKAYDIFHSFDTRRSVLSSFKNIHDSYYTNNTTLST